MDEVWKDVVGFESSYEVSSLGRVRSKTRLVVDRKSKRIFKSRVLSPGVQSNNYLGIWLYANSKSISRLVHHLVAEAFIGPRPDGMDVDHVNGDRTNNSVANLRYLTIAKNRSANHRHKDAKRPAKKGKSTIRIVHPGGGSSYAISYTSQKLVESYSPGEKPNILLMGHYHKMAFDYIRGVYVVQGGCTMDQSPFIRKKRLDAHVGGWICEVQQGENGVIQSFKAEWVPFYSQDFYDKEDLWKYQY